MNMKFMRTWVMLALTLVIGLSVTGGTIAWFTDSVETATNVIESGNLDMVVEYWASDEDGWQPLTESTKLFKEGALYEPGYTEWVALRIANNGNLAFKWQAQLDIKDSVIGKSVLGNDIAMSDYLSVGTVTQKENNFGISMWEATKDSTLKNRDTLLRISNLVEMKEKDENGLLTIAAPGNAMLPNEDSSEFMVIVLHMPEDVDNKANHNGAAPQINLGVRVVATQATVETDSFGTDYDAGATYPTGSSIPADLPKADVTSITPPTLTNDAGEDIVLNTAYSFKTTEEYETAQFSPYAKYHADFVVSVNNPLPANTISLAGQYDTFSPDWLLIPVDFAVDANDSYRLLDDYQDANDVAPEDKMYINYEELCLLVKEFKCGAYADNAEAAKGTTMTVELRLYEVKEKADTAGNTWNEETGRSYTVASYTYTF